ncbi:Putative NmrA-like family protein [Penicillium brasilianum]|uniref:Putative NmrA-like family protein n=1 Tax=Penicillium brasilianum TaxID=104259 RepID=A0A0F7U1F0_PENBI|nr:Putative NmrA-like family protein [Penicillium brasilianum]
MTPSILIVGATGNTGRAVAQTLAGVASIQQLLVRAPRVEVIEQNWAEITADWLHEHQVARAFIASHVEPSQFAEESTFHLNTLNAGVKYVVRISTTAANVRPDCPAYYPRQHWAIEALLGSPEFDRLQWTSLQPNIFSPLIMSPAVDFIKKFRETGQQDTLRLLLSKDAPVGVIDPDEIGAIAAHLLSLDDTSTHNKAKYVLNGPEDINGMQIVAKVEQHISTPVKDVSYMGVSFIDMMYEYKYAATKESKNVIYSIKRAPETAWEGKCSASTTSPEILKIAAPKCTPADTLKTLLEG